MQTLSEDMSQKLLVALVGAVAGFLFNYLLDAIKRRREPLKRLSYDIATHGILPEIADDARKKLEILYEHRPIVGLFKVVCQIENTGNRTVKEHNLRFEFGPSIEIVETNIQPQLPEFELKHLDSGSTKNESRWLIGHFDRRQKISFEFLVNSNVWPELIVYSKNEDVDWVQRSVEKIVEDEQILARFLRLGVYLFFIPPLVRLLPLAGDLKDSAEQVVRLAILLPLLVTLPRTVHIVARVITAAVARKPEVPLKVAFIDDQEQALLKVERGIDRVDVISRHREKNRMTGQDSAGQLPEHAQQKEK